MKRIIAITILASLMLLIISATVCAQGRMGRGFGNPEKHGMHMKNLESLRLLKLLEVLDLDDNQNDRFISAFSKFRRNSKSIREQIDNEVTDLREYLGQEDRADNAILEKVDLIVRKREEIEQERKKFFERIKDILTPEQLGRMMVFQERFERELLEQVRGFRAPKPFNAPDPKSAPDPQSMPEIPEFNN